MLGVIAPHECVGCLAEGALLCANCRTGLAPVLSSCYRCQAITDDFRTCTHCRAAPLKAVAVVTTYTDIAKDLVWRLKFERARAAAGDIAQSMHLPAHTAETLLVHIPTATNRVRQRGYDQARLIAHHLACRYALQTAPALARLGQQRQVGMKRQTRQQQLQQAFCVPRPASVAGKHIILIDDVLTTGATLEAAAAALKQAGARRVDAAVFARA